MIESGTVQAVYDETLGSVLVTDVVAADATLYLATVAHFSPGGGQFSITDGTNTESALTYSGVDEATQTLTGVSGIANGYDADDSRVSVFPTATVRIVEVRLDGQQDTVRARLPYSMFDKLTSGFVADTEEESLRVLVELSAGEYVVNDVLGTVPSAILNTVEVLDDLRVEGTLTLTDTASMDTEAGVHIHLNGQQADPSLAPTITQDWETDSQWDLVATSTSPDYYRRSWYHDTGDNAIYYVANTPGSGNFAVRKYDLGTGTSSSVVSSLSSHFYGSITRVGTDFYCLVWNSTAPAATAWVVRKYNSSWVYQSQWTYSRPTVYATIPVIASDGTDLWFLDRNETTGLLRFRRINTAGTVQETLTGDSYWSASGDAISYHVGNFDYGAESHVFVWDNDPATASVADSTGARVTGREFTTPFVAGETAFGTGMAWDGANFWGYGSGGTASSNSYVKRFKLEQNLWTSGSAKGWVGYTWYESTNPYETLSSPIKQVTLVKRKRWLVQAATLPTGGAAPPDSIRVYIGRGNTEPASSAKWLQGASAVGANSMYVTDITAAGTALSTITNTFPGADPAIIEPSTESGWSLKGDETTEGFADIQTFTTPGTATWTKPKIGGLSSVEIILIGGGGGGGSGRKSTGSAAAYGGGGGGGASVCRITLPISVFNATETVTVGGGGLGGGGRTTVNDGNAGQDGTSSKMTVGGVADFLIAKFGNGGSGGTATTAGNGGAGSSTGTFGELVGTSGGDGGANGGGVSAEDIPQIQTTHYRMGATGGGGGGGVNLAGTAGAGGNGGRCYDVAEAVGGATSIAPDAGGTKLAGVAFPGGGGGGSGGRPGTGTTKNGGAGGKYGGGGGGSGGGQTVDSGDGGAGGDGIVVVICR